MTVQMKNRIFLKNILPLIRNVEIEKSKNSYKVNMGFNYYFISFSK